MTIVEGKQLIEHVFEYDTILFGMGINNSMNNGFAYDICINFPEVKENEDNTGYGDNRKYGKTHETKVNNKLTFCACYCYNIGLKAKQSDFIDYESLEKCLLTVKKKYKGKKIASPIIGQDKYDGNGDKGKLIQLFDKVFGDCNITLYDFEQEDFKKERYKEAVTLKKQYKDGDINKETYIRLKKENEWKRLNGIYKEMPDDFVYKLRRKAENKIFF